MRNYTLALFMLICFNSTLQAQDTTSVISNVTRITFLNPGISYEMKTGKASTIYLHAYTTTLNSVGYSSTFGWNIEFVFDPSLSVQYRFYYNIKRRLEKGKRVEKNSLNYIAPIYQLIFSKMALSDGEYVNNSSRRPVNEMGVVWGMQRNYKDRFSFGLNVGPGIYFGKDRIESPTENSTVNVSHFGLIAQVELGIWLGKR